MNKLRNQSIVGSVVESQFCSVLSVCVKLSAQQNCGDFAEVGGTPFKKYGDDVWGSAGVPSINQSIMNF